MTKTERIAVLNDQARQAMGVCCRLLQTAGVAALPSPVQLRIRETVETFSAFTKDNDPHGERDFGSFNDPTGRLIFWKIDYYARDPEQPYTFGSEDPSDPSQTARVLTIMLAEEY
jgi:Protein of unknown function (DUF3768)